MADTEKTDATPELLAFHEGRVKWQREMIGTLGDSPLEVETREMLIRHLKHDEEMVAGMKSGAMKVWKNG